MGAALRPMGAGVAGIELVFFLLVLAGRAYGPGFGFVLGNTTLFASALLTGGIGPWLPFQMLALAWMGAGAGFVGRALARLRIGLRTEVVVLAVYGWVWGFLFGAIMNLWFWPFSVGEGDLSWSPGLGLVDTLHRYWSFYAVTSFGWDAAGALANAALILLTGGALLPSLRRFASRLRPEVTLNDVSRAPAGATT
jgi:energy-coupling factor transport system substrate-specific component